MLADLYAEFAVVRETFAEAAAALGYDLWALVATINESYNCSAVIGFT